MRQKKPIIAITGSSGAGTTTVSKTFSDMFRREKINASYIQGDSFRRYNRVDMEQLTLDKARRGESISHFGPEANLFEQLETQFRSFSEQGHCKVRQYYKNDPHLDNYGTFSDWQDTADNSDILLYEGFHGGVVSNKWTRRKMSDSHHPVVRVERRKNRPKSGIDVAQYIDLLIGIVPVVNIEWIQKIHRDSNILGHSRDSVTNTIVRRMQDYVHFIIPQFSYSDINFQRIPLVDTSNPFIIRDIPNANESMYVIRFREPKKYDLVRIREKLASSFLSRPNTLVIPGGKLRLALELICTPIINLLCQS